MSNDPTVSITMGDDDDARVLWQATARADALLGDLAHGRDAQDGLDFLLGFLREVVLARITHEDRHLLPALRQAPGDHPELDQVADEHLRLRSDIDDLAAAAQGHRSREEQVEIVRRFVGHLEAHLAAEAALLHTAGRNPEWVAASHWFALTEGPVIDIDALRADQAEGAVLNRLSRLHPGEHVELRGRTDPHPLWLRLQQRYPGGYAWEVMHAADGRWSVGVLRRAPA